MLHRPIETAAVIGQVEFPVRHLKQLDQLMDPEGTAFNSTGACDKFIERCRNDFYRVNSGFVRATD